ncbi:MAG: hypothetical protein FWB93_01110 [Oscillospiraceae bacterium]|nr:hypothetical protein [Oscillospiraceae bacterium]
MRKFSRMTGALFCALLILLLFFVFTWFNAEVIQFSLLPVVFHGHTRIQPPSAIAEIQEELEIIQPPPDRWPLNENLDFELPINGASGFSLLQTHLRQLPETGAVSVAEIQPGEGFRIISGQGSWWYVDLNGQTGWIDNTIAMINLPDIIPSIIYNNINHSGALFRSSGYALPQITYNSLYNARHFNARFAYEQYVMPVLYRTARKVYTAQQSALQYGYSIIMYDTFRPRDVQVSVRRAMEELMGDNPTVHRGVTSNGWSLGWFISTGISGHQLGISIDVGLARIEEYQIRQVGDYWYKRIVSYYSLEMPTQVHELSALAIVLQRPTQWNSNTRWANLSFAHSMTPAAITLHNILVEAGFGALSSEWWHFDDLDGRNSISNRGINGDFHLRNFVSAIP